MIVMARGGRGNIANLRKGKKKKKKSSGGKSSSRRMSASFSYSPRG